MKFTFSSTAIGIVAFACLLVDFSMKNWEKEERVIEWDVHSYYEYLPAYFIYDDIKFEKSDYRLSDKRHLFWPVYTEDGRKVIKMSMGTAFFYAPFFFTAHAFACVTDYPEDGFSEPYKIFLLLSTVFFLIMGLDFLKKILQYYNFSDKVIATVILLLGLGTNMLCYASHSAPMSHIYSFCVFVIFIYYTIKWYGNASIKNTLILGLLFGLISLIRPTNSVIVLFFILSGVSTIQELKVRISFFFNKYFLILIMGFCTLLVWVPQIIYWKVATGNYICYSYNDEGFFFTHPRIIEGLFSWRKGWLVYTPMMAFALIGIFFLKGELKKLQTGILVFMIVNIYVIFSWWCWWYGGTMGQRSFIEGYALLAIPFASFIQFIAQKKWYYNAPFYLVAIFFIWLNIFQTYQFESHALHYDGMTKELYFKQFGRISIISGYNNWVNWPDYEEAKKGNSCDRNGAYKKSLENTFNGKKESERKTIQLKAFNGNYLCADQTLGDMLYANRKEPEKWETFSLILFQNMECSFRADNDLFLSAQLANKNEISATQIKVMDWEVFTLEEIENNFVAFKAANGKYLSVDKNSLQILANGNSVGEQEKFEMITK